MTPRERWIALIVGLIAIVVTLGVCALFEYQDEIEIPLPFLLMSETVRTVQLDEPKKELCVDPETRDRIRALSLEGYDEAYKQQMAHLFTVWLKDETDQPTRASRGSQQAISAYIRARKLALAWNPPPCPQS